MSLEKIFDPYFTTKQRGSDLGLAISYSIIGNHDGHIDVESHPGIGTTFHIYIPASPEKEGEKPLTGMGKPFDIVILDLTVPGGMGGEGVVKKFIEIDTEVKALVSSGYSDAPIMANYREFGFCGIIAKPYKIKELNELRIPYLIISHLHGIFTIRRRYAL